jgi:hypothetical protein
MVQTNVSLERCLFELMKGEKDQIIHVSCGFDTSNHFDLNYRVQGLLTH